MVRAIFALVALALAVLSPAAVDATPKVFGAVPLRHSADFMYTSPYDNKVYMATASASYNGVQVVNLDTMKQEASIQLPRPQGSGNSQGWLTLGQKFLYCATGGSGVNAYSLKDGKLAWSYPLQNAFGPAYIPQSDQVMFVKSGMLVALDANSGKYLWNMTDYFYWGQPFVTADGNNALIRTHSGDIVGLSLSSISPPTKNFHLKGVNALHGGSALQAFESSAGNVYVAVGTNIMKLDPSSGSIAWTTSSMTAPTLGSWPNNLLMADGPFQLWAYNGSKIGLINQFDGDSFVEADIKSNYVNGLVNLDNQDMLSISNSADIEYYSINFHTYTGKFTVPNATSIIAALPTKGGTKVALLTNVPSVIVLEYTS